MHDMEVLPTRLAHNPRVSLILVQIHRNILPEFFEHESAPREMQCSETAMVDRLRDNLRGWAGDELDNTRGDTRFGKDLVYEVVGIGRHRRGFPDDDIADEGRSCEKCELKGEVEGLSMGAYFRGDFHRLR